MTEGKQSLVQAARRLFYNGPFFRRRLHRAPFWPLVIRVHGFIDGPLIWTARKLTGRTIARRDRIGLLRQRLAWPFWAASNRVEGWQFRRNWRIAQKTAAKINAARGE